MEVGYRALPLRYLRPPTETAKFRQCCLTAELLIEAERLQNQLDSFLLIDLGLFRLQRRVPPLLPTFRS